MKECFEVRYNLQKMVTSNVADVAGALSAIFGNPESELEESVAYYNEKVKENAKSLREKFGDDAKILSDKKIAFFGDSITSDRLSYANVIINSGLFSAAREFAVSGITSTVMAQIACGAISGDDYDYVCVYIGTNDEYRTDDGETLVSVSEYERNLRRTAELIKKRGAKGILFRICDRPDCLGMTPTGPFNAVVEQVAKDYGFTVIATKKVEPGFISDRIHLDEKTQQKLAEALIKTLLG